MNGTRKRWHITEISDGSQLGQGKRTSEERH